MPPQEQAPQPAPPTNPVTPEPIQTTPTFQVGSNQAPRSKKKRLLAVLVVLLLVAGGAAAWFLTKKDKTPVAAVLTPQKSANVTLLYAQRDGNKTTIRELKTADGSKKDIFSFDETPSLEEPTKFYPDTEPSVDLSADGKTIAYTAADGIYTRDLTATESTQIVKMTGEKDDNGTVYTLQPSLEQVGGPPGIYGVGSPVWSKDGQYLGFGAGHYEGGTVAAINVKTKAYAKATDTFRYISDEHVGSKFTINTANKAFRDIGLFPSYTVTPDTDVIAAAYNSDRSGIYTLFCPKDLPDSGNSKYDASAFPDGANAQDCGEAEDGTLVSISLTDGTYKTVAHGKYGLNMTVIGTTAYVPLQDNKNVSVVNLADGTSKTVNISTVGAVSNDAELLGIRTFGTKDAFAVSYFKTGEKYSAVLVDLATESFIGNFDLATNIAFKPLAIR